MSVDEPFAAYATGPSAAYVAGKPDTASARPIQYLLGMSLVLELHRLIVSQVPPARQPSSFVQRVLGLQFEIFLRPPEEKRPLTLLGTLL